MRQYYGYTIKATGETHRIRLESALCLFCMKFFDQKTLRDADIKVVTVLDLDDRSFFHCVHKDCWDKAAQDQRDDVNIAILGCIEMEHRSHTQVRPAWVN